MKLSMRWLREYVDIDESEAFSPREFSQAMTMSGSKVEGYEDEAAEIQKVVVGRVLSVTPHPDSDHLVICSIDTANQKPLQIVTGANNVAVGSLVPVALDGSRLPGGKEIKTGKLRGELSEGMLCSLSELSLTAHDFPYAVEDGIFLIEEECQIGQPVTDAIGLNDICVEFEITPNRPDCLSVLGLAREVAATYKKPLKLHTPVVKGSGGNIAEELEVSVLNQDLCPRYTARMVKNVKIAPSPRWLRERLRSCGVRPINNLVDITNYVMLEYGQPLHAFDANLLGSENGKRHIVVRNAKNGESIETLDGVIRPLKESILVITDGKNPVAIAGVMGGENSAITEQTNTVIFESANFLGSSIRAASKALGLRTDASSKYEKGLDPQNTMGAILRACELVELLSAGEVVDGLLDVDASSKELRRIKLETEWINRFLGISLSASQMEQMLLPLGIPVENGEAVIPSFRADIENKADIAEEIARLYGYDNIPTAALSGVAAARLTDEQKFERAAHQALQASGCFEVSTYSFISPKYYDNIRLKPDSPLRHCVVITNPLGEETSVMRTTTLPSMLEVLSRNFANRNSVFFGYEIGNEYIPIENEELPAENPQITVGIYGGKSDFYTLKGIIEVLLERLNINEYDVSIETENESFHPARCAKFTIGDTLLGVVGEVHPTVLESYAIDTRAYLAKFDLNALYQNRAKEASYTPLPKYPAITRDLSLICEDDLPIIEVEKAIKTATGDILESVALFDVYKGTQVAENKKSVSYSLILRSKTATLTDTEAEAAVKRALKALEKINVQLRA